jgi:hypothetical protein
VSNQWLERRWSIVNGETVSLYYKPSNTEWIVESGADMGLIVNGHTLEPGDVRVEDFAEENTAHGAAIIATRRTPNLKVTTQTEAWHQFPALVRTHKLLNLTQESVIVDAFTADQLTMGNPDITVITDAGDQRQGAAQWESDEPAACILVQSAGLFFGQEGGGRYTLFTPDDQGASVAIPRAIEISPLESITLPRSFVFFFHGSREEEARSAFDSFLAELRRGDSAPGEGDVT